MEDSQHRNYVGGRWVPADGGRTLTSLNPADHDDVLGTFPASTTEDVAKAVEAARDAFPGWRRTPVPKRADYVLRVGLLLEQRKEELARLMTREMGKTLRETRADVQEGIDFCHYMAGEGRRFFGLTMPAELPSKFSMTVRHPAGVAALITPWNFPVAIPLWKIAPAGQALRGGRAPPRCAQPGPRPWRGGRGAPRGAPRHRRRVVHGVP